MAKLYFVIILVASILYSIGDIEARRYGPSPPPALSNTSEVKPSSVALPPKKGGASSNTSEVKPSSVALPPKKGGANKESPVVTFGDPMVPSDYIEATEKAEVKPLPSGNILSEVGPDPIPIPVNHEEPKPSPSDNVLPEVGLDPSLVAVNNEELEPVPSGNVLLEPIPAPVNYEEPLPRPRA